MKLKQDKCHLLVSGCKHQNVRARIRKTKIWKSKKLKPLRIEINKTLSFDEYIACLFKKAGKKLSVLVRLSNLMCTNKKRVLMKAFIESQFYVPQQGCQQQSEPFIYMSDRYKFSVRIILVLSKIYLKRMSHLLFIRGTLLAIEIFKVKENLSNNKMCNIFQTREVNYNFMSQTDFASDDD